MKKRDFLKIAASVIATPIVASALDDPNIKIIQTDKTLQPKIAIDMSAIDLPETGMAMADIMLIFYQTGVLIYRDEGNTYSPISFIETKETIA